LLRLGVIVILAFSILGSGGSFFGGGTLGGSFEGLLGLRIFIVRRASGHEVAGRFGDGLSRLHLQIVFNFNDLIQRHSLIIKLGPFLKLYLKIYKKLPKSFTESKGAIKKVWYWAR
jgi:hypothetical protein